LDEPRRLSWQGSALTSPWYSSRRIAGCGRSADPQPPEVVVFVYNQNK